MTATVNEPPNVASAVADVATPPAVEIVVPVYNEERDLGACIRRLHDYLTASFPFTFRLTIADNASTDDTWQCAELLAAELSGVHAVHLEEKGRGRALYAVWTVSDAPVLAYTDVDLSTDLNALLPLVAPLLSGHSDVAIGSRLTHNARVIRGPKRELISRAYNTILHATLSTRFSDAQCGFKAIRADRARLLLPYVEDTGWFFDTELLVLAERAGMRIHEVPVDWVDDTDSRVDLVRTAIDDLKGIARMARGLATGRIPIATVRDQVSPAGATPTRNSLLAQVTRFAAIGVMSTITYLVLYLLLRTALPAQLSNAVALLTTAVANTAANRHYTFGIRGGARAATHQLQGLAVFIAALTLTSGSLAVVHAVTAHPARSVEVTALVAANLAATLLRFVLLRNWVFRANPRSSR
jgi:putative flippase GtrA